MHFIPSGPDSWYNLPRDGGVAYAAQESWVLNETIKARFTISLPSNRLSAYSFRTTSFSVHPLMKDGTKKSFINADWNVISLFSKPVIIPKLEKRD